MTVMWICDLVIVLTERNQQPTIQQLPTTDKALASQWHIKTDTPYIVRHTNPISIQVLFLKH